MRNNIWLTIENTLAVSWWEWVQWYKGDQQDPEPPIAEWDKNALTKVIDHNWTAKAYKKATIPQLAPKDEWRLWNMYDIKLPEWLDAGYAQHGRAEEGGDLGAAGVWYWEIGDPLCTYDDSGAYPWKPSQVLLFMPDVCANEDCTETEPATKITDVSLLMGQPCREFPSQP